MQSSPRKKTACSEYISLGSLATRLDADPSSVRRWLREAEIKPVALSNGPKGAIRYLRAEVDAWLARRDRVT